MRETVLNSAVSHCTVPKKETKALRTDVPDIFFSYSWKNSYQAKEEQQIQSVVGNAHTDPRLIKPQFFEISAKKSEISLVENLF